MITVGVLTISDGVSRGQRVDTSGPRIEELVSTLNTRVVERAVVPDEREQIAARLRDWTDRHGVELIITTGGTGLAPRDVTPEATRDVIDREVPGLAERMRMETAQQNIHAVLSRGVCGARGRTLILNLPGNPKGVEEMLSVALPVLPHAIDILKGLQADHTPPKEGGHQHAHGHEHHGHRHA